ncbi:hypothetical protein QQ045_017142 [Rhodiola kirilowii]
MRMSWRQRNKMKFQLMVKRPSPRRLRNRKMFSPMLKKYDEESKTRTEPNKEDDSIEKMFNDDGQDMEVDQASNDVEVESEGDAEQTEVTAEDVEMEKQMVVSEVVIEESLEQWGLFRKRNQLQMNIMLKTSHLRSPRKFLRMSKLNVDPAEAATDEVEVVASKKAQESSTAGGAQCAKKRKRASVVRGVVRGDIGF